MNAFERSLTDSMMEVVGVSDDKITSQNTITAISNIEGFKVYTNFMKGRIKLLLGLRNPTERDACIASTNIMMTMFALSRMLIKTPMHGDIMAAKKYFWCTLVIEEIKWYALSFPLPHFLARLINNILNENDIKSGLRYFESYLSRALCDFTPEDFCSLNKNLSTILDKMLEQERRSDESVYKKNIELYNERKSLGYIKKETILGITDYRGSLCTVRFLMGGKLLSPLLSQMEEAFNKKQTEDASKREHLATNKWTLNPSNLPRPAAPTKHGKKFKKPPTRVPVITSPADDEEGRLPEAFAGLTLKEETNPYGDLPEAEKVLPVDASVDGGDVAAQAQPATSILTPELAACAGAEQEPHENSEFNLEEHFKAWEQLKKQSKSAQSVSVSASAAAAPTSTEPGQTKALEVLCSELDGTSPKFKTVMPLLDRAGFKYFGRNEQVCIMWVGHDESRRMEWFHIPHDSNQKAGMKNDWGKKLLKSIQETYFQPSVQQP